jgi:hypothetical protein
VTVTAPTPSQAPARRPAAPPALRAVTTRVIRIRTVPGRVRAIAAVVALAVAGVFAVATLAVQDARDGLRIIGHGAGPQVVATGDLYYALSDMDAQLAGILLMGREQNLGDGRAQALKRYDERRSEANRALLQGTTIAGQDPAEQRTAQSVLDALGRYERLAGQAVLLDEQQSHAAGRPGPAVTAVYRQAADIMKLDVLPKAYNLTLDNGTTVRRTYESKHASVLNGRVWVALTGLVLIALLIGLQLYLAINFRRLLNPLLALATVGTLALVIATIGLLSTEAGHLSKAKNDGFDSVLSLSRARAISNNANADETRFLLDPDRADTYEQVYLDKSQEIVYVPAGNLGAYYGQLDSSLSRHSGFMGFFGAESGHVTLPGQRAAVDATLSGYQQVQHDDRDVRARAATVSGGHDAIVTRMGTASRDYARYDTSLVSLTNIHEKAFEGAIRDGDHGLSNWDLLLPGAAVVIVLLVIAGVRPRLVEFR